MDTTGMTGKLYQACQWISRLAYLNLLWLIFISVGLVIFGVAPSTVAMFTIIRKWIQGEREMPIFSTFIEIFKREFWTSNRLKGGMGPLLKLELPIQENPLKTREDLITSLSQIISSLKPFYSKGKVRL